MRRTLTLLIAAAAAALISLPAFAQETAPTTGRAIAGLASVPLTTRTGARTTLGTRVQHGKPTLISIWASWCPPCVAEAPYLAKIRKDLGGRYNFLYIDRSEGIPDPEQPAPAMRQFLTRAGLDDVDYLVADVAAYRRIVGADLRDIPDGKVGIPRVYLFDAQGRQIHTAFGFDPADGDDLERRVKQAIERGKR